MVEGIGDRLQWQVIVTYGTDSWKWQVTCHNDSDSWHDVKSYKVLNVTKFWMLQNDMW